MPESHTRRLVGAAPLGFRVFGPTLVGHGGHENGHMISAATMITAQKIHGAKITNRPQ